MRNILQVAGIDQLDSMLGQFVAQRLGKVGSYQTTLNFLIKDLEPLVFACCVSNKY